MFKLMLEIVLEFAAIALALAGITLAVRAAICAKARRRDTIACPPGIEWSGYVNINGVQQWMLIRGEDAHKPLLLYLHGGPGSPETILAGRRYSSGIEKHFVVVHWEQRGTCKSYRRALERAPLTNHQLIEDVDAVSRHLLTTYRREKLYLIGHSHGSLLGIVAIANHPERYYAYIGVGQFVNSIEQERISLRFALDYLERRGNLTGRAKLAGLGEPPYRRPLQDIFKQRATLWRAGGTFGPNYPVTRLLRDGLLCPHCGTLDMWRFVKGQTFSARSIVTPKHWELALDKTHLRFCIPVCFFVGRRDYNTPSELAERYFDALEAPRKEKVIFENAAHMIPFEEPERFNREVVRVFVPQS